VKGGFEVRIAGSARAFCPFSQMGIRREESKTDVIGK
jgi:small subunit ribosomal protein S1